MERPKEIPADSILVRLVYIGARVSGTELMYSFKRVDEKWIIEPNIFLSKKARKYMKGSPGCMYDVWATPDVQSFYSMPVEL